MSTLVEFTAALVSHVCGGAVADIIGQRFTPIPVPPDAADKPCATYTINGCVPQTTLDAGDDDGLLEVRFQVDAWANDFAAALALAEAIRIRLQSASFKPIPAQESDNGVHVYEDDARLHRFHWRYIGWFST